MPGLPAGGAAAPPIHTRRRAPAPRARRRAAHRRRTPPSPAPPPPASGPRRTRSPRSTPSSGPATGGRNRSTRRSAPGPPAGRLPGSPARLRARRPPRLPPGTPAAPRPGRAAHEDDPVKGLLPQAEQGLAGGEVAGERAVHARPDQRLGLRAPAACGLMPRPKGPAVVVGVGIEALEPKRGLPTEHHLRERRWHRLREDVPADQLGQRATPRPAAGVADLVEADELEPEPPV